MDSNEPFVWNWTPEKGIHMETGTKINQPPELYLAADVEPYAKGGWKTTVKASVRVFNGNGTALYDTLASMLANGLSIAQQAIENHENPKEQGKVLTDE